jgi:hypothetical protein
MVNLLKKIERGFRKAGHSIQNDFNTAVHKIEPIANKGLKFITPIARTGLNAGLKFGLTAGGAALGNMAGGPLGGAVGGAAGSQLAKQIPSFKSGGKVKGPKGKAVVALVHSGEYVLPTSVKPTKAQKAAVSKLKCKK